MFSIPNKLTSPFGLLGDDAKLAFRSQTGISRLSESRNIPQSDEAYWSQYVLLFDSASDVYSLISPHDIRRALMEAPENVATLVQVLCARLFTLMSDHTFPSTQSVVGLASSFIGATSSERNPTKEVLNCLRVLQRVLPVIFESEDIEFEEALFWKKEPAPKDNDILSHEEPQFVIEDEDEDTKPHSPPPPQQSFLPSLAERLFSSIIDLLFCCGFTVPLKIQIDHHKINYFIWEKGIGSTVDVASARDLDSNRAEVLRLLLVLLSNQIYRPPTVLLTNPSKYTTYMVQSTPRRHVLTLLCSLLNTAMNSSQPGFQLPYNHLVWKGEDPRQNLVSISLQVLAVVLDYQAGNARDIESNPTVDAPPIFSPTSKTNAFRYFLSKLHRAADFQLIADGILGILEQQMNATGNNLLPGSRKQVPYVVETFILLWKMIELNKKFRSFLLEGDRAVSILAYLLYFCLELKDKPQHHGLCRALTYIVQSLSAEPSLGSKLSLPIKVPLPSKWNTLGTAADFMITSIYSIVATTSGTFNSLYPALIIALSNCAPYFMHLSITSSTRLLQLLVAFSNPSFLLSDEGHPRLVFFMLEVLNNILFHHLAENPNVVYAILRSHKTFEDLGTFTLGRGLREIRRIQLAKEEQDRNKNAKGKAPMRSDDDGPDAAEEKARLLAAENGVRMSNDLPPLPPLQQPSTQSQVSEQAQDLEAQISSAAPGMSSTELQTMSPTESRASLPATEGSVGGPSEKARGKMRQRSMPSDDMSSSLERIAAAGIGRNGFVPTQEWVTSWQRGLPLDPSLLTISELLPKVQELQSSSNRLTTTPAIIDYLRSVTLKHILPPIPPLSPRKFQWSDASIVWLTSLIWGEIYVRSMTPLGIWNGTNVRLFYVKHAQPAQTRQITEAVSNVVGGLLGRNNPTTASGGAPPAEQQIVRGRTTR